MKKSLNQHVTRNKNKRNDILDYSWCFETALDLMSEVENEFDPNLVFDDISILLKSLVKKCKFRGIYTLDIARFAVKSVDF